MKQLGSQIVGLGLLSALATRGKTIRYFFNTQQGTILLEERLKMSSIFKISTFKVSDY